MVFIEYRDGVFDASIGRVWMLVQAHVADGAKIHPSFKNITTDMESENVFIYSWEENINGQTRKMKEKGTIFYPLGVAYEFMEGQFKGSKYFIYYIPQDGNKTRVIMAGDFILPPLDSSVNNEEDNRSIVLSAFENVFDEDCTYLKSIE
jgi:hypothetical protein